MKKLNCLCFVVFIILLLGCVTNNTKNNSNIDYNFDNQGLLIKTKDRNVKLFITSKYLQNVKERQGGGQNNPNYFYFIDKKVEGTNMDLHFSGWLLPIENYKYDHVADFWLEEYGKKNIFNHDIREFDKWQAFLYDIPVPENFTDVFSSHMRANLLYDDTWIDLHLSITDKKPSEILHNILFDYLKNIQIKN